MVSSALVGILALAYGLVAAVFLANTIAELRRRGRSLIAAAAIGLPTALLWPVTVAVAYLSSGEGRDRRRAARRTTFGSPGLSRRT